MEGPMVAIILEPERNACSEETLLIVVQFGVPDSGQPYWKGQVQGEADEGAGACNVRSNKPEIRAGNRVCIHGMVLLSPECSAILCQPPSPSILSANPAAATDAQAATHGTLHRTGNFTDNAETRARAAPHGSVAVTAAPAL